MATGGLLGKLTKKAAPAGGSKKKEAKPQIQIDDLGPVIEAYLKAAADAKDADGRKHQHKGVIASRLKDEHKKACRTGDGFHGSVEVNKKLLAYVQYNAGHNVVASGAGDEAMEKIEAIQKRAKELFGSDADRFFAVNHEISFRAGAKDEKVLEKIIEAVGGMEEFNKLFEIKARLTATEELAQRRFTDPKVDKAAQQMVDEGTLKDYSPSLKEL